MKRVIALIGVTVTSLMFFLVASSPPIIERSRDLIFDSYQKAFPRPYDPSSPVHVIDVDERAISEFGQWPWPRTYLAQLTERLFAHGAVAIGFDILFSEPDRTSPEQIITSWSKFNNLNNFDSQLMADFKSHDTIFADIIKNKPVVLAIAGGNTGATPSPVAGIAVTGNVPESLVTYEKALGNINAISQSAAGLGTISVGPTIDGVIRTIPVVTKLSQFLFPSLSTELLRVSQGAGGHILQTTEASGKASGGAVSAVAMRTGSLVYPVEADGQFRVYFSGSQPRRITSASEVLAANDYSEDLALNVSGRIILVGSSAQGLLDLKSTPLNQQIPGVILHAEVMEQIISGEFIERPDWMDGLEVLSILLAGILTTALLFFERPILGLLAPILITTCSIGGGFYAFYFEHFLFNPTVSTLTAILIYLPGTSISIFSKEKSKRIIRSQFAFFLPAELISEIEADPVNALTPKGAERELTVLFTDIRGFSTITEGMAPDRVVELVNTVLSALTEALIKHGATIDKYMGDAVMAFWNAPIARSDHVDAALQALPDINDALRRMNIELKNQGLPEISIGVGINTGVASVGMMGSYDRLSYTCLGESVTLASRFEGLTRQYGVMNCVGAKTASSCPSNMTPVLLDLIAVKGFERPVEVYTIIGSEEKSLNEFNDLLQKARDAYVHREWKKADMYFAELEKLEIACCDPTIISQRYRVDIAWYLHNPPPNDWVGERVATEKR